jgi:hypothetical protein
MLTATLTRPGTIAAADITLTSREPTLAQCRALIDAGRPDQPMTVVDSATGRSVMQVASIAKAALLTVDEGNRCRFRRWRPFAGVRRAPGVASGDPGVGAKGLSQTRSWRPFREQTARAPNHADLPMRVGPRISARRYN